MRVETKWKQKAWLGVAWLAGAALGIAEVLLKGCVVWLVGGLWFGVVWPRIDMAIEALRQALAGG